jgi:biotin carboxylase
MKTSSHHQDIGVVNDVPDPRNTIPLHGRKILLVNIGSPKKTFILRRMKELGLRVVALHTERTAWAEPFIEDWLIVGDSEDASEIVDHIRAYQSAHADAPIEGAITFWEEEVPLLARICEEFGFTGNSLQTGLNTRSKFVMQELLKAHGRNAIRQQLLRSEKDLARAMETVGFPAIMKPLYGSDSLFVVYVESPEEARKVYEYLRKEYKHHPYELLYKYENGLFVYQEFIEGTEFSVECYAQNAEPHVVGVHEKTSMQLPYFIETGDIAPPRVSDEQRQLLEEEAKAALIAVGVTNSLSHIEMKMSPRGPQVIEIASRMGGDDIFSSVLEAYDFDMVRTGCEIALGIPVSGRPASAPKCTFAKYFIPTRSGNIIAMDGFSDLKDNRDVVDFHIAKSIGETIQVPPDGYEVAGWALVSGETHDETQKKMNDLFSTLKIGIELPGTEKTSSSYMIPLLPLTATS